MDSRHSTEYARNGRCSICFAPLTKKNNYCPACGCRISHPPTPMLLTGVSCVNHVGIAATHYCSQCEKPICGACVSRTIQSCETSMEIHICHDCEKNMKNQKAAYIERMKKAGCCGIHHKAKAEHTCVRCGLPICSNCAFYIVKGRIFKKRGNAPYCPACFLEIRKK